MGVGVFGEKGEIESGNEVGRGVRGGGEVEFGDAEVGEGELGAVGAVEHVEGGAGDGGQEDAGQEEEDGPEAAAAAGEPAALAAVPAVGVGGRAVGEAVWVVEVLLCGARWVGGAVGGGGGGGVGRLGGVVSHGRE